MSLNQLFPEDESSKKLQWHVSCYHMGYWEELHLKLVKQNCHIVLW